MWLMLPIRKAVAYVTGHDCDTDTIVVDISPQESAQRLRYMRHIRNGLRRAHNARPEWSDDGFVALSYPAALTMFSVGKKHVKHWLAAIWKAIGKPHAESEIRQPLIPLVISIDLVTPLFKEETPMRYCEEHLMVQSAADGALYWVVSNHVASGLMLESCDLSEADLRALRDNDEEHFRNRLLAQVK